MWIAYFTHILCEKPVGYTVKETEQSDAQNGASSSSHCVERSCFVWFYDAVPSAEGHAGDQQWTAQVGWEEKVVGNGAVPVLTWWHGNVVNFIQVACQCCKRKITATYFNFTFNFSQTHLCFHQRSFYAFPEDGHDGEMLNGLVSQNNFIPQKHPLLSTSHNHMLLIASCTVMHWLDGGRWTKIRFQKIKLPTRPF